jgi:hypothetical protein
MYAIGCVLAALWVSPGSAPAQTKAPFSDRWQSVPPKTPAAPAPAPAPAQNQPVPIDQALYLIRSALLTLNDANRSGNYSVLRDLAAPDFQARNTAADLAGIFANLRQRRIDLHAAAMIAPQLAAAPALDDKGMLRLTGLFPTQPQQIKFDLLFQNVGGEWRLFGISIATPDAVPPTPAQVPAGPAPGQARAQPR